MAKAAPQKRPAKARRRMSAAAISRQTAGHAPRSRPVAESGGGRWTFLTNHAHVLILLSRNPSLVLREVAAQVGITERAVQRIIADLQDQGFIEREKVGRQNQYRIRTNQHLRHPIEAHRTIGQLLGLMEDPH